ncbi:uncharacterized protein [Henckelia pumila]|uniref:uncharacterized protein n=1 Tax=Henckelia pumila TaxID=405737 RepID=UPI003C6E3F51
MPTATRRETMPPTSRRPKWHPAPPPSPKILNFPRSRRTRRKQLKPTAAAHYNHNSSGSGNPLVMEQEYFSPSKGKLGNLFDQKNNEELAIVLLSSTSNASAAERRERVVEREEEGGYGNGGGGFEEEKWRFQAEILRAECNFLRMEREFALRKLERNRVKMERTLRSAIQTLVSGKEKIFDGKNAKVVLEEEIEDLEEKIEELRKESRIKVKNCSNFDKKACILQSQLEKFASLSQESCSKELAISESRDCLNPTIRTNSADMDMLKKKMEGLSKGVLDRVEEEYVSMLSSTANSSVASSASTSKRIDLCPEFSSSSSRQLYQEPTLQDENKCSGRCKAIIRRIVEQVRAETEQWSQMQEMLGQVRGEMEELRTSRDFWENRSLSSDYEIQTLRHSVEEWKEKALGFQNNAGELQLELLSLKEEIEDRDAMLLPLKKQLENEKKVMTTYCLEENHCFDNDRCVFEKVEIKELNDERNNEQERRHKELPPLSLGKHLAKEKRMVLRRSKETRQSSNIDSKQEILTEERRKIYRKRDGILAPKQSPLQDIGNSLPMTRQAHHCKDVSLHQPSK